MTRSDVINQYIKHRGYSSYLEIGVGNPRDCFHRIQCEAKTGVDPAVSSQSGDGWSIVCAERAEFSEKLNTGQKFDLIFIDGLHTYEAVKADTEALLPHLSEGGVMLLDDVAPLHSWLVRPFEQARQDRFRGGWMGEVWRWGWEFTYKAFKEQLPYDVYTLPQDHSMLAIDTHRMAWRWPRPVPDYSSEMTFTDFLLVRPMAINLLPPRFHPTELPWALGELVAWDSNPQAEPEVLRTRRRKKKDEHEEVSDPVGSGMVAVADGDPT